MLTNDLVLIQDYDPTWPDDFSKLSARVNAALGDLVLTVEHIGSTAVPGLAAKPIIDLDVVLASPTDLPEAIQLLARIGYVHEGDLGIAGREAFRSPDGEPRHHLYVLIDGADELRRHLAFRDALRADDGLRDRYATLKRGLAEAHRHDRSGYTEAKSAFIATLSRGTQMTDRPVAKIRVATPDDAPALAVMHVASWRETYAGILPDKMLSALSVEGRAAAWAKIMQEPANERSTVVYLAEHDGTIVGFGSCGAQRTDNLKTKGYDGEFSGIYVLRAFQGQGIGASLLAKMSLDLLGRGFSAAALWVLRDNPVARRFYEHHGGKVIAEREDIRDGAVLVELAYGWADLKTLDRPP